MATNYLMQAVTPAGDLITWRSVAPDFAASSAPTLHDGAYRDIALAGGGIDTESGALPTNAIVLSDGSQVTLLDGSFAVTG